MKAMILAAGAGSRLAPLTDNLPKALVPFQGQALLDIVVGRLKYAGFDDITINVHHFADQIIDHIHRNDNYGIQISISSEDTLLDTGGGIRKAIPL